jgi:hypothetical protein
MEDGKQLTPEQVEQEVKALEEQEKNSAGLSTDVTTVKAEEAKTPEAPKMTKEQMLTLAARDYIGGLSQIQSLLPKMSSRGVRRVLVALLRLPEENLKVNFQTDEEKMMFGIGQRVLNAKTTIILHHIQQEIEKNKTEQPTTSATEEVQNVRTE